MWVIESDSGFHYSFSKPRNRLQEIDSVRLVIDSWKLLKRFCSARDWDGKDYLRIIPRVVW
jgi:hypothetical protein